LVYRALDDKGNKIGGQIKASLIYKNPDLKFLEQKLPKTMIKPRFMRRVKTAMTSHYSKIKSIIAPGIF